jgi:hypothetical protein
MGYRPCTTESVSQLPKQYSVFVYVPAVVCAPVVVLTAISDTLIAILLAFVEGNCERVVGDVWSHAVLANTCPSKCGLPGVSQLM